MTNTGSNTNSDQKNKPCACIIGTTAGMAGLMLVPIGE